MNVFRKLFASRTKVLTALPAPKGGEIHGHLFENPKVGVSRNVYWAIRVELGPLSFEGEDWDCSVEMEWLIFPIRSWTELDGITLSSLSAPDFAEASAYVVGQHCPASIDHLSLKRIGNSQQFRVEIKGSVSVDEPGIPSRLTLDVDTVLPFTGVIVIPENLTPKPSDKTDVTAAVSCFLSPTSLGEPLWDRFRFVLPPALNGNQAA